MKSAQGLLRPQHSLKSGDLLRRRGWALSHCYDCKCGHPYGVCSFGRAGWPGPASENDYTLAGDRAPIEAAQGDRDLVECEAGTNLWSHVALGNHPV